MTFLLASIVILRPLGAASLQIFLDLLNLPRSLVEYDQSIVHILTLVLF